MKKHVLAAVLTATLAGPTVACAQHGYGISPVPSPYGYNPPRVVVRPLVPQTGIGSNGMRQYVYPTPNAPVTDPTQVRIHNVSRFHLQVLVDGKDSLEIEPGMQSPRLNFDMGRHQLDITGYVVTHFGPRQVGQITEQFEIDPKGHPVVITVPDQAF